MLQEKLDKTALKLLAALEMAKSNESLIDQGVSGYWLYRVETWGETAASLSLEQNEKHAYTH